MIASSTPRSVRLLNGHPVEHVLTLRSAVIYLPHSYFVTDHKQAWREEETAAPVTTSLAPSEETAWALEEAKRLQMRRQMFPNLRDDTVIFANWNQLYKVRLAFRCSSLT